MKCLKCNSIIKDNTCCNIKYNFINDKMLSFTYIKEYVLDNNKYICSIHYISHTNTCKMYISPVGLFASNLEKLVLWKKILPKNSVDIHILTTDEKERDNNININFVIDQADKIVNSLHKKVNNFSNLL